MIIDVHNHPYWYGYSTEEYIKNMDECKIDVTCLLTWESPEDEYDPKYNAVLPDVGKVGGPINLESCLKLRNHAKDRFVLGYAPDPRKEDCIDKLLFAKKTYGVKLYGELKLRMAYDNLDAIRAFRVCGKENLPVLVHLDDEWHAYDRYPRPNYWYGGGIYALERVLKRCPDTAIVGHAPAFWAYISGEEEEFIPPYRTTPVVKGGKLIQLLDDYPNLYCDISAGSGRIALTRDPEFTQEFLTKYQDRVLFGRDYYDDLHRPFIEDLRIDDTVKEKIFYKNAIKLLDLKVKNNRIITE